MTRKDLDKLLDHAGVQPDDSVNVVLAEGVEHLDELEPGSIINLKPRLTLHGSGFLIQGEPA